MELKSYSIEQVFKDMAFRYCSGEVGIGMVWEDVHTHYKQRRRTYHNIHHLEQMLAELAQAAWFITDWDAVVAAVVFHDAIYKPSAKDNEERSAELAYDRLMSIGFPDDYIQKCVDIILATKSHVISKDQDINYFLDADLSIFGKPWSLYEVYMKNIRKEFRMYPDILYNPGRKKVLQHFISMKRIYKTEHFYGLYEEKARENLAREIDFL